MIAGDRETMAVARLTKVVCLTEDLLETGQLPAADVPANRMHADALRTLLAERVALIAIARAAGALESFLNANVGETRDWPVRIVTDDTVAASSLARLLNELKEAMKP